MSILRVLYNLSINIYLDVRMKFLHQLPWHQICGLVYTFDYANYKII